MNIIQTLIILISICCLREHSACHARDGHAFRFCHFCHAIVFAHATAHGLPYVRSSSADYRWLVIALRLIWLLIDIIYRRSRRDIDTLRVMERRLRIDAAFRYGHASRRGEIRRHFASHKIMSYQPKASPSWVLLSPHQLLIFHSTRDYIILLALHYYGSWGAAAHFYISRVSSLISASRFHRRTPHLKFYATS